MTSGYMVYAMSAAVAATFTRYVTLPFVNLPISASEVTLPYCQNVVKKLWIKCTAFTSNADVIVTLRKNGAPFSPDISVTVTGVGVFSLARDGSVADGDLLSVEIDNSEATSGSATVIVGVSFLSP